MLYIVIYIYMLYASEIGPSPSGTARAWSRQKFHEGEENHGEVQPVPGLSVGHQVGIY